jgi:hypothetical protein
MGNHAVALKVTPLVRIECKFLLTDDGWNGSCHCDNFLHLNDFYIFLNARVLSTHEMALIRNARFTMGFSGKQIDFDDSGVEGQDFRQIHAERPDFG